MKKTLHTYSFIIGLFVAFVIQGCSLQNEIEDLEPDQNLPTVQITAPTSSDEVTINPIAHMVTVSGTITGENLTSLSYTLDGTEVAVTSFDGSSPDFTFDLDFSHLAVGTTEDVSLKLTVKNAAGKEGSETVAFKVKMIAYENPTVVITSPTASDKFLIAANVPTELAESIANTAITITGTIQSIGASTYTYDIGNGPQALTVVNGAFSQEILLSNVADLETKNITLTITATDEASQTGSGSVAFSANRWDIGTTSTVPFTYSGTPVTYKTVRAKDGNIWLQQHLGSSQVATSATDIDSYGDLFQWGRWADGHQKRTSALVYANTITPNNPTKYMDPLSTNNPFVRRFTVSSGVYVTWWPTANSTWTASKPEDITANDGCDPCKAIGTEWRLPTRAEWDDIITKEGIGTLNDGTPFSSTLKLPSSGYRDLGSAIVSSLGTRTFLWSSNNYTTATSGVLVDIKSTTAAATAAWGKGYGGSVRCIKKN